MLNAQRLYLRLDAKVGRNMYVYYNPYREYHALWSKYLV